MISNLIEYLKSSGMKGSKYTATNRPKSSDLFGFFRNDLNCLNDLNVLNQKVKDDFQ